MVLSCGLEKAPHSCRRVQLLPGASLGEVDGAGFQTCFPSVSAQGPWRKGASVVGGVLEHRLFG